MNRNINSKIIRYSIRKLSLGAAAVIVGALIFGNYTPENIAKAGEITFKYVEENELNESEKVLIKREIPERYKENRTYYLVYKKINEKKEEKLLPNTGDSSIPLYGLGLGTAALVVLLISRKNKNKVLSVLLIGALGQSVIVPYETFALENKILKHYNMSKEVNDSTQLKSGIIHIPGYKYVGFLEDGDVRGISINKETERMEGNAGTEEISKGRSLVQENLPEYTNPVSTKGTQEPGRVGESAFQPELSEYTDPVATKGTQEPGRVGESAVQENLSEYTKPLETKGTQEPGRVGESTVQEKTPEYTGPVSTKGTQEPGRIGESVVREESPEYTNPVSTKGTQEPGRVGESTVQEKTPEYTGPVSTKGTQEPGRVGESVVREDTPEYSKPLATKGTQEPGQEGESAVQPELPEYKVPEEKKGTQEPGHEGESTVREETPEYTKPLATKGTQESGRVGEAVVREETPEYSEPLATKGTQEPGRVGESAVREEAPEYKVPEEKKGTQEPGHEGESAVREETPEYTKPLVTKGTQEPGREGESAIQPELPEYTSPASTKGTQEPGREGESTVQQELPEYTSPVSTKGTQEPGHEGESVVREETPEYTKPLVTKGTQELGHEGESAVNELPEYTDPVATKGTQEPGRVGESAVREEAPEYNKPLAIKGTQEPGQEGESAVQPELPEYKVPEETKGTQEPGRVGEAAVREETPEYTNPVSTKGTQEPGREGESAVREDLPEYTNPVSTKGTQEPGHEGESADREETPEYTKPLETKGTQEPGYEGESAIQPELPEYKVSEEKKGTQEPGHEGESAVQEEAPEYTNPVSTKGTQEPGRVGESAVNELPEYTDPVVTKGTQEPGRVGESAVQEDLPEYTNPVATKGTQEPGRVGESAIQPELPEYTNPVSTKGTQEPGRVGEAAVREETPGYTKPLEAKGTQEPGREGQPAVYEFLEYTDPVGTNGTQEPGHRGESVIQSELPEYTKPIFVHTVQSVEEEMLSITNELPEYKLPVSTKGTQEPGHEGEAAVTEEIPTLEVTTRNRTEKETIPYRTEEIQDPTLLKNRRKTEQPGQVGTRTIQYEDYIVNGNVVETKEVSRTEKAPVKEIVKVGTLVKTKPVVEITNLVKDEDKKSITVSYNLTDSTSAYVSAKAQIFHENRLVKEVDIENLAKEQVITGLDHYTPYTIKTLLTYNLGENNKQSTEISTKDFELEYKKIEIKDVDAVELYGKEDDGRYRRYLSLDKVPTGTDNYFVKVKSDRFKEMYLPVKSITENSDGTYKVTATVDELVQDSTNGYKENYTFNIAKSKAVQPGVYTSFKQLITAMRSNMSGVFKLASDMTADEVGLTDNQTSYLSGEFTGTLIGTDGSKAYAIYDLRKPLFDTLRGATVKDLDIKNVDIDSDENAAAVAKTANNATISNVAVEGKISGRKSVAGLIVSATNTTIENSAFTGKLVANHTDSSAKYAGGIVGNLIGENARINKSKVDVKISSSSRNTDQVAGGIVGRLENGALVSNSVATGEIRNGQGYSRVGGIVGSTWRNGRVNDVVSNVDVGDGYVITGDQYNAAEVQNAVTSIDNKKRDMFATKISEEQLTAKIASYGITVTLDDTGVDLKGNERKVDYTTLNKAQSARKTAYNNIEKLMPFYNKELIVKYGNKVASTDKLYTTELLDVVPMKGNEIVTDIHANKGSINRIMLHFKDNTVDYLDVTFKENFKNNQVVEYNVAGKEYIYTPEAFISDYTAIANNVLNELQSVTLTSDETKKVLGITDNAALDNLYLDREFDKVKTNIAEHLRKVLAMDKSINTAGAGVVEYVSEKIKKNKEAFMLGLTYMNRWYNINYDDINTKDLSTYKFDFNGNNSTSTLDTIIELGKSGLENLQGSNTVGLYGNYLAQLKGEDTVFDFVEAYRKLFLPTKTNNQWLKDNSKAYIVESKSSIKEVREKQEAATADSKYTLGVYDRISAPSWGYRNMLLPLLTLPEESVYVMSNLSTLAFGSYERYRDNVNGKILSGDALRTYVRGRVDLTAKRLRDHYDIWYNLLNAEAKERLFRSLIVYDGFRVKNEAGELYWARLNDKNIASIRDFFGPVGKWYEIRPTDGAYANGSAMHFVTDRLLDDLGPTVYSHEMVHNSDSNIYFEGYGRREGQGAELFALGLLESAESLSSHGLVLNTVYEGNKDDLNRVHAYNPVERFNSDEAIRSYMHGSYDVLYTLDAMEAAAVLGQSNDVKKKWFRKLENYYVRDPRYNNETHAGNKIRPLTDEEVAQLTTLESLIDNNIINRRGYDDNREYRRNGYYMINMFSPVYSALSNSKGAPGDIMFRKIAYELLAEKGYHKGFLPYVSNQYAGEAFARGNRTFSAWFGRDVGLVTDELVLEKVFDGEYETWGDFKKEMFYERIDKQDNLKPITIQYELGKANSTKEVTITSAQEMQELINEAVARDITNIDRTTSHAPASWVHLLKQKIYNAYLRITDDFKESIYK